MNASNNNGEHEKNINDASLNEYELKIEITINPPRKVLPESPIKTFDGCQFQNKKAIREEIIKIKFKSRKKEEHKIIKIIEDATKPSIPSIKLIKFIIPIRTRFEINQNTKLIKNKLLAKKLLKISEFNIKKLTNKNWTKNLNLAEMLILSSIKPNNERINPVIK